MNTIIPPALSVVAKGRDHINSKEFAHAVNKNQQYIRKLHYLAGEVYGIRPIKIGNRLLWPVLQVAALLNGGQK